MIEAIDRLSVPILAGVVYEIGLKIAVTGSDPAKPPALMALSFEDASGRVVPDVPDGFAVSELFGTFRYVGRAGQDGDRRWSVRITPPPGAVRLYATLYPWRARKVAVPSGLALTLVPLPGQSARQAAFMTPLLLAQLECPVIPARQYLVDLALSAMPSQPERFALAAVCFEDADGAPLPVPGASRSERVGPFRYLTVEDGATGPHARTGFVAPPGAVRMHVRVLRWKGDAKIPKIPEITASLEPLHPDPAENLSGSADLEPDALFCLRADLGVHRRDKGPLAYVDFLFFDAGGDVIFTPHPIKGLARSDVSRDHALLSPRPGPGDHWPAVCRAGLAFFPPPGAVRLVWRIRALGPPARLTLSGPVLTGTCPDTPQEWLAGLEPTQRCDQTVRAGQLEAMRATLSGEDAPWPALRRQETILLGEYAGPSPAGNWVRLTGRVGLSDPERPGIIMITPRFYDAAGQPLEARHLVGCTRVAQGGLCRLAVLSPSVDGDTRAQQGGTHSFAEDFLAPEGAALMLAHVIHWPEGTAGADLRDGTLQGVLADRVGDALVPGRMSRLQAQAALQIAGAAQHPGALVALHRVMAAYETKPGGHTVQVRQLSDRLRELDPNWCPALPTPAYPRQADPDTILYLVPSLGEDDAGRRAVALARARGAPTALCLPLPEEPAAVPPGSVPDGPDGIVSEGPDADGISRHRLRLAAFSGIGAERFRRTDRLTVDARLFQKVLTDQRAGLVQAMSGTRGYDMGLRGLALARAHDLPFVYERTGFHEHFWRRDTALQGAGNSQTRLRLAQEWRVMQAADAVVVASEAMRARLLTQGLPAEKLHVVPQAGPAVQAFPSQDRKAELPALLPDRAGVRIIGHVPDPSRPGGETHLLAALAGLRAYGVEAQPVFIGAGPEARIDVPAGRSPIVTGPLDETQRHRWISACDLLVFPGPADRGRQDVPPLAVFDGLAAAVPLILPDLPWAAALDSDLPRVPADDVAALGAAVLRLLGKLPDPRALADLARAVLAQWNWADSARALSVAHDAARANHARRRKAMSDGVRPEAGQR